MPRAARRKQRASIVCWCAVPQVTVEVGVEALWGRSGGKQTTTVFKDTLTAKGNGRTTARIVATRVTAKVPYVAVIKMGRTYRNVVGVWDGVMMSNTHVQVNYTRFAG